jgi:hypothetical protein
MCYIEQQNQLEWLARIVQPVISGAANRPAGTLGSPVRVAAAGGYRLHVAPRTFKRCFGGGGPGPAGER